MPRRTDIDTILIIGAGPIVIGQACEFDYSGTQACKALKAEGYRIVLVNSNPATIMTDPDMADATYIEPITPEMVARIIERERAERPGDRLALLPTMGGQTALNTALSLKKMGVLEKHGVEMIGATAEAIDKAEDRELFREAMTRIGLDTPKAAFVNTSALKQQFRAEYESRRAAAIAAHPEDDARAKALAAFEGEWATDEKARREEYNLTARLNALKAYKVTGLPAIIRPSFTMGGTGGGIAYTIEELYDLRDVRRRSLAHQRGAGGRIGARLEGVRDGGRPRQGRQLHHHLLHREHRPDGRAHRRFDHRCAGADADRQGIPDHA